MSVRRLIPGVLVAILLAVLARGMSDGIAQGAVGLPKFPLSPVLCAVLIGMLWRNTLGVPAWTNDGLNWAMHRLLRTGIALVGLRLTLAGASAIALTALPVALGCLATALVSGIAISRLLSVPEVGSPARHRDGCMWLHGGGCDVTRHPRQACADRVRSYLRSALRLRGHAVISLGGRAFLRPVTRTCRCIPGDGHS